MMALQHGGHLFQIKHAVKTSRKKTPLSPLLANKNINRQLRRNAWKKFLDTGHICEVSIPVHVADSWRRSQEFAIDPTMVQCANFVSPQCIEAQSLAFMELAGDVERDIYKAIKGKGLLLTVTDFQGHILRRSGDKKTLRKADELQFGEGAIWSECSMGTNAIGLTLVEETPVQLIGEDHFCSKQQTWGCSAAPIFSLSGQLWGCFDISGPTEADHSHCLWLAMMAARKIERALFRSSFMAMEHQIKLDLNTLFGSLSMGVCVVNEACQITYTNDIAESMLTVGTPLIQRKKTSLHGAQGNAFFDFDMLGGMQSICSTLETRSLLCRCNPSLSARITPLLHHHESTSRYAVITLHETSPEIQISVPCSFALPEHKMRTAQPAAFKDIVYRSDCMAALVEQAEFIARSDAPVLIHGETGTGKGLFAKAIHAISPRTSGPFVALNCGSLPKDLIQSELFGYEEGAFTGASKKGRPGKFELANTGTLFLDEISEMPLELQANLLRPLEERTIRRLGGQKEIALDYRLITATNRPLDQLVSAGTLREDIFYRIHVLTLEIPPLRQRKEDIEFIAHYHCQRLARKYGFKTTQLSQNVVRALGDFYWPGNVRQLVHCMEFAVTMAQGACILPKHLPAYVTGNTANHTNTPLPSQKSDVSSFTLSTVEEETIKAAIKHYAGNMLQAAKALGIGRNTLYAKLRKIEQSVER